jgi:hypothetical protein
VLHLVRDLHGLFLSKQSLPTRPANKIVLYNVLNITLTNSNTSNGREITSCEGQISRAVWLLIVFCSAGYNFKSIGGGAFLHRGNSANNECKWYQISWHISTDCYSQCKLNFSFQYLDVCDLQSRHKFVTPDHQLGKAIKGTGFDNTLSVRRIQSRCPCGLGAYCFLDRCMDVCVRFCRVGSRDISVGVVTRLRVGRPRKRGSIPGRTKRFFSCP